MREIKFRIWDGEDMSQPTDYEPYITRLGKVTDIWWNGQEVDLRDEMLLQFTGRKTDDGQEIYEGDIIETRDAYGPYKGSIVWWEDRWALAYLGQDGKTPQFQSLMTVKNPKLLGNVYQHKHLLDGKV
jgi:hypothetical protein